MGPSNKITSNMRDIEHASYINSITCNRLYTFYAEQTLRSSLCEACHTSIYSIVWQAPAQIGTATSATLSFAGASGYGEISRHTITLALSNAPGTTATPTVTLTTSPPTSTSLVTI